MELFSTLRASKSCADSLVFEHGKRFNSQQLKCPIRKKIIYKLFSLIVKESCTYNVFNSKQYISFGLAIVTTLFYVIESEASAAFHTHYQHFLQTKMALCWCSLCIQDTVPASLCTVCIQYLTGNACE